MNQTFTGNLSHSIQAKPHLALAILLLFVTVACRTVMGSNPLPPSANQGQKPSTAISTAQITATAPATTHTPEALVTTTQSAHTPTLLATRRTDQPTPPVLKPTVISTSELTCVPSPITAETINKMTAESWLDWIEKLSGAEPVTIDGQETTITTRYSPSMFDGQPNARAFEFVLEQVQSWYPEEQIEQHSYTVTRESGDAAFTWKNLVLTLPGEQSEETVILSAHLDSTSQTNPEERAPGAEDNASGSAALLEAARLFQNQRFARTIQIIWFTGEEQGLLGSENFVEDLADPKAIVGVVNLDMFGYDADNDRCFEVHVGPLPQSDAVGQCFVGSIKAYNLDLPRYDYLTDQGAVGGSDHGNFWNAEIGAIEILENMFENGLSAGCSNADENPHYHSPRDTVDQINPETGLHIARAGLAAVMDMAVSIP